MRRLGVIRRDLNKAYRRLGNWRAVGREFGISGGMAFRMAVQKYEPKEAAIRVRLGLPAMAPAPVCMSCGLVHVSKRCTAKVQGGLYRDLWDVPVRMLKKMLEERRSDWDGDYYE